MSNQHSSPKNQQQPASNSDDHIIFKPTSNFPMTQFQGHSLKPTTKHTVASSIERGSGRYSA